MKLLMFIALGVLMCGCVDVKIASEMPRVEYYSLQNPSSSLQSSVAQAKTGQDSKARFKSPCQAAKSMRLGVLDMAASTPFDSSAIYTLHKESLQMRALSSMQWINSPKEMLKIALLNELQNHCFNVASTPFGTQKLDKILKTTLLSLQVVDEGGSLRAEVSIFYELLDSAHYRAKSGTITRFENLESLSGSEVARGFAKARDEVFTALLSAL